MTVVLAIGAVALLATAIHAAVGFGSGPLLVPALLLVAAPSTALVAAVLVGMAVNVLQLVAERRRPRIPVRRLAPLWLAAPPATLAGAALATELSSGARAAAVAVVLLACAAAALAPTPRATAPVLALGGALAGFAAALTGIFGPLLGALLLAAGSRGDALRDAIGVSFLVVGTCAVAATLARAPDTDGLLLAAALLLPAAAGHALGRRAFRRLDQTAHRTTVVATMLAGVGMACWAAWTT